MSPHVKNKRKILFVLNAKYDKASQKEIKSLAIVQCVKLKTIQKKVKEARLFLFFLHRSHFGDATEGKRGKTSDGAVSGYKMDRSITTYIHDLCAQK